MTIIIATEEELRILTKSEREVYDDYRQRGKTREDICIERGITEETFRSHLNRAEEKMRTYRRMRENPQAFMAEGKDGISTDVLRGGKKYRRKPPQVQWDSEKAGEWGTC